ncbi:hypothetical protein E2562_020873 [Oryza meyeriana var. granulata]|uniref:Uncharacterized protein n=1 Tax=Oryza meyeriana var. granulata TaxID=110450 RepID=A0A6G1D629_9ORYZ|nr:hypothetical protein E2562_020873 [Oryza meyeriana var. granulata]
MKNLLVKILSDVSGTIGGALADEHHLINKLREYLQDKRSNEENFVALIGASNLTSTPTGKIRRLSFYKNSEVPRCQHTYSDVMSESMAKLEYLHILTSAFRVKSEDGSFDFGVQHLSCLTKVYAYINCYGWTAEEAEAAKKAIMDRN